MSHAQTIDMPPSAFGLQASCSRQFLTAADVPASVRLFAIFPDRCDKENQMCQQAVSVWPVSFGIVSAVECGHYRQFQILQHCVVREIATVLPENLFCLKSAAQLLQEHFSVHHRASLLMPAGASSSPLCVR